MNIQRLMTDLNKLYAEWVEMHKSPDLTERSEWVRGTIHGIKLALQLVSRHINENRGLP